MVPLAGPEPLFEQQLLGGIEQLLPADIGRLGPRHCNIMPLDD
jgi:hypothetical protein